MTSSSPRTSAKQRLIDVASEIVSARGVQELTLEAVAAAAGVTKGGLIYHFKTRDELLAAVVQAILDEWDQRSRVKAAQAGSSSGALLRALIDDTFDMEPREKQLISNLLAAASSYPHLLGPVRDFYSRLYGDFAKSGSRSGTALVIAAALDGMSVMELLSFHQFSDRQRKAMRQALHALAKELP
ncbi:TetR/AcrR family transcriptional regulator [Variovorax paradoxus]|uniref:TetR/AcrR family transcriptional regulator n=1 Tax=Variovorax paradoxus TaxID=34073 RepID=UPI0021AB9B01|nr:TetR/AcrR family transcriptional regulator [Variovorax paradoxus]UVH57754.1 TetR/AcrR family transcriptional regulator [Variovorax paradoxus]